MQGLLSQPGTKQHALAIMDSTTGKVRGHPLALRDALAHEGDAEMKRILVWTLDGPEGSKASNNFEQPVKRIRDTRYGLKIAYRDGTREFFPWSNIAYYAVTRW